MTDATAERAIEILAARNDPANGHMSNRQLATKLGVPESAIRRAISASILPTGTMMKIPLASLVIDPTIQSRAAVNREAIADYREIYEAGGTLPPLVAFELPDLTLLVSSGFHRAESASQAGIAEIECEVIKGTHRDAKLYALSANNAHGVQRTTADKNRSIEIMLEDEVFSQWSDRRIGKHLGIAPNTIGRRRAESTALKAQSSDTRKVMRNGVEIDYKMPAKPPEPEVEDEVLPTPEIRSDDDRDPADYIEPEPNKPRPKPAPVPKFEGDEPEPVKPMTDDEWLASLPVYGTLSELPAAIFRSDALAYRAITTTPHYLAFAADAKKIDRAHRRDNFKGGFLYKLYWFLRIKHPREWLTCLKCEGAGCDACNRRGYVIS